MKRIFVPSFFLLLFLLETRSVISQTVIFSENMGTGAFSNPSIPSFSASFQNSACSYTFTGSGNVSTANSSSGAYTGASGGNNVVLNSGSSLNFIVSGINTLEYSSLSLSYGLYNNNALSSGAGLAVAVSTDGISYTALNRSGNFWLFGGWLPETCTGTIPSTQNLYIRFINSSAFISFRIDDLVLTGTPTSSSNPTAYNSWPASYTFTNWPSSSAAGTYPANILFHYGTTGAAQPLISNITASYNYANAYSLTALSACASLVSGQGSNGVSFVNRNPGNAASTGNLGETVLALNTTCRASVQVTWRAGTISNNATPYKLRAQYRVGNTGAYTDLPNASLSQIEYTSPASGANYGPITLPASCENQALVQIRWVYYYGGSGTGTGDEINLTNIGVSSLSYPVIASIGNQTLCGSKTQAAINFSSTPAGASFGWSNSNTSIGLASGGTGNLAAFATPSISAPPDKVGVITLTASLNGCSNTASFSITVKGPQAASIWTGASSGVWDEHFNWSNCACTAITSATIPAVSSPSFIPILSGTTAANVNSLTLNSGAVFSVQGTQTINLYGSWINNGTFNTQSGSVILCGSTAQNFSGSSATAFYNLTLNNAAGASLSSAQQITGSLQLNSGTFNTNNLLTLAASAAGSGKIGPINAAADIINRVTVQQYAPGGSTGWALLGSPISTGLSMVDWNDNFTITCLSCPNGSMSGFTSVYAYDETIAGSYSATAKYIPLTSISNSIDNGKGYWVYLGNNYPATTAINFDVSGTVAKSSCLSCSGPVTIPVSRTNNTSAFDDGWNLVANPLPSPISWTALRAGNTSVDNAIYVYNADLNSGTGAYATYINGVSSTLSGGINDTIPMCQGFYVHASNNTSLVAGENIKINANPAFLRTSAAPAKPIVRLVLNKTDSSYSDMATFYLDPGGTTNFQTDLDAYKLIYDASLPYLGSMSDSALTSVNGLPDNFSSLSVPVKAIAAAADSFYFSLLISNFPNNICISLYDSYTNITTDLRNQQYRCLLQDTTTAARFSIHFFSAPLLASSTLVPPNCQSPYTGTITAVGSNAGPWDYEWKNGTNIIKTSQNKNTADTLVSGSGNYTVKINTSGQCDQFSQAFNVASVSVPGAGIFVNTPIILPLSPVNFISTSVNAQSYVWNFGDGTGTSVLANPIHSYSLAGNYTVLLVVQSSSGCIDSATALIAVDPPTLLTESMVLTDHVFIETPPGTDYVLVMDFATEKDVTVELLDAAGRKLIAYGLTQVRNNRQEIDLSPHVHGIYYLKVQAGDAVRKTFKLLH